MKIRLTKDLPPIGQLPESFGRKGDEFETIPEDQLPSEYQGLSGAWVAHPKDPSTGPVRIMPDEYEVMLWDGSGPTTDLHKSGDKQQYPAQPHEWDPERGVVPTVRLISITPDPLGTLAFLNGTYTGVFYESKEDPRITDELRMQAWIDMHNTHLQAPLEAIKFHFRFDGVDRAFTHQLVRYRTGMYAQESLRFSVVGDLEHNVTLPPSLFGTSPSEYGPERGTLWEMEHEREYEFAAKAERWRMLHDYAVRVIDQVYTKMVETGMPAEEARGLLPTEVATRINWLTDFRNMKEGAGQRLCTQAQFHWRKVWNDIVTAIANYSDGNPANDWQYQLMAQSSYFRPICYQLGRCPMKADFDRACTIRQRVDILSQMGVPSEYWSGPENYDSKLGTEELRINPAEWLMDPSAARL